jgi:hypothetical protein
LYENFGESGIGIEWHDFLADRESEFDWSRTFRSDCLERLPLQSGIRKVTLARRFAKHLAAVRGFIRSQLRRARIAARLFSC